MYIIHRLPLGQAEVAELIKFPRFGGALNENSFNLAYVEAKPHCNASKKILHQGHLKILNTITITANTILMFSL